VAEALIAGLRGYPHAGRLTLRFNQRVERLVSQAGRVCGAAGVDEKTGAPFEVGAEQVVVAAGGINGGDLARVRQNWHRDWRTPPPELLNGSHRFADGKLHDATAAVGGVLTHLDNMWNYAAGVHHPRPRKPRHGLSLVPPRSALWLNWRGERIGPQPLVSGFDTRRLVSDICAQQRQYSWQLMNKRIALKELAISGAEHNPSIRDKKKIGFLRDILFGNRWLVKEMVDHCPDFVTASTLPELVEKMNALQGDRAVELAAVKDAVEQYDATIARGASLMNDEQLRRIAALRQYRGDRIRLCKFQPINDTRALPLIAVREFIISRKSLGGIKTDLQSRVIDASGQPIEGLYAVGEAAGFGGGGVHGLRALEGTSSVAAFFQAASPRLPSTAKPRFPGLRGQDEENRSLADGVRPRTDRSAIYLRIPGVHTTELYDALNNSNRITQVLVTHEGGGRSWRMRSGASRIRSAC